MRALILLLALASTAMAGEPDKRLHERCLYPTVLVWTSAANGSGVIVRSVPEGERYRNTVLTVAHVASKGTANVYLPRYVDWSNLERYDRFEAKVIRADPSHDISVLSFVSDAKLPTAEIDPCVKFYIGNPIHRFGAGLSKAPRLDAGEISGMRSVIVMPSGVKIDGMILASLLSSPGDSGGPVYEGYRLIGLCQSIEAGQPHISYITPIRFFAEKDWR